MMYNLVIHGKKTGKLRTAVISSNGKSVIEHAVQEGSEIFAFHARDGDCLQPMIINMNNIDRLEIKDKDGNVVFQHNSV